MAYEHLFSRDVRDEYENGRRVFENIEVSYAEMEGFVLDGIVFKNCKFSFTSFRLSKLKNARFISCEFFFGSFYGADLEDALFENMKMDFIRFDTAVFSRTIFRKCSISYSTMMNANVNAAEFSNCVKFKVFDSAASITESDLRSAAGILMPVLETLDMEIKARVMSILSRAVKDIHVSNPIADSPAVQSAYGSVFAARGYENLSNVLGDAINIYNKKHPYRKASIYERANNKYKK